ncbi:MAG: His/Gly/Thr/Pro-type tRNA ligase C-terminal domain-containing protein, partial [Thermoanaerobaculia bacterium]|nr:His/Gly/Thr/Pro-type tRNA ligase C-terminal domain-containing protein [Thermoanaerobaculia bacterium]
FEIESSELGAQSALVGGGRYDSLIEDVGGPATPSIGFAIGLDRLVSALPEGAAVRATRRGPIALVRLGEVTAVAAMRLAEELRADGLEVVTQVEGSLRSALRRADRQGASAVVLLGDDEVAAGRLTVKRLADGEQIEIPGDRPAAALRAALGLESSA